MGKEGELKSMARQAKARLKSGYWVDRKEKLKACLERSGGSKLCVDEVKQYFSVAERSLKKYADEEDRESRLYPIVCDIIESDDGLNPLGRLIDREYYESLDFAEKQRYVLELSDIYKKLSERYLAEREIEKRLNNLAKM